jgi:hypothetical protein
MGTEKYDIDWCRICQRVIAEGQEHNFQAHGSNEQSAEELKAWKQIFE